MSTFELGITSATVATLYPEWDYKGGKKQIRSEHRTRAGRLYLYNWGDYEAYKFKVDWVPASDAALVNSWWEANSELLLFITSSTATEVHSVMLMNDETPLLQFTKPYDNYYKGKIELESY